MHKNYFNCGMFYQYSEEELITICRTHIENIEKWALIFINNILSEKLDVDYFYAKGSDGNYRMKKSFVENSDKMMSAGPLCYPTLVDTLFVDDIIYIPCKPDFTNVIFFLFAYKVS